MLGRERAEQMATMLSRRTVLVAGAWLGAAPRGAGAQSVMRASTLLEQDPATTVAERVMRLAYARLGLSLVVQAMPGERSLISSNNGDTDAELYRRAGIDRVYTNLLQVPVALLTYEIVAFARTASIAVRDWESLRPHRLSFVRGVKIIEEKTVGMQTSAVATMQQAFTMLERDRSDLVLANRASGLAAVRAHKFAGVKVLAPPLASFPVFHYLNRKHEPLLARLTAVLRELEHERMIARIQEEELSSY